MLVGQLVRCPNYQAHWVRNSKPPPLSWDWEGALAIVLAKYEDKRGQPCVRVLVQKTLKECTFPENELTDEVESKEKSR